MNCMVLLSQGKCELIGRSGMMKLEIEFAKNKCLSNIRSTETITIAELIQQDSNVKTLILCNFTN